MILIKPNAKVTDIKPEVVLGILMLKDVFDKFKVDLIVTEATGGKHMEGSLHYKGLAVDIRSKHIQREQDKVELLLEAKEVLGNKFDFILESRGKDSEHYHLEYQPKEK